MSALAWTCVYDPAAGDDLISVGETTQLERDGLVARGLGVVVVATEPDFGIQQWDAATRMLVAIAPPPVRRITPAAFRERFTAAERIQFEMLTVQTDMTGAVARDLKADLAANPVVNLDASKVAAALAWMRSVGVLQSDARIAELTVDGTLSEAIAP
jgi:hypothetical protein